MTKRMLDENTSWQGDDQDEDFRWRKGNPPSPVNDGVLAPLQLTNANV
jgi:hypothetical protein